MTELGKGSSLHDLKGALKKIFLSNSSVTSWKFLILKMLGVYFPYIIIFVYKVVVYLSSASESSKSLKINV